MATVQDLLDALDTNAQDQTGLVAQLRAQLIQTVPTTTVTTAAELKAALAAGGLIDIAPAPTPYVGRWDITQDYTVLQGVTLPDGRVAAGVTAGVSLQSSDPFKPALEIKASHVRVTGVTCLMGGKDTPVVRAGSAGGAFTDPLMQPDDVVLDQIEVLADPATGGWRGVEAHTRAFSLLRSRVCDFWYQGRDSQAFWSCNGPGPYQIVDNHLEATGENILFGGGSIRSAAMHPANATITGNTLYKPQAWRQKPGSVKNLLELKAMLGATIEHNLFDGCWKDAQTGPFLLLTPRNQYNDSPFVQVKNIVIRNNRSVHCTNDYAINILYTDDASPSQPTEDVTIEHNLFEDSVRGILLVGGLGGTLRVTNNTLPGVKYNLLTFDHAGSDPAAFVKPVLVFRDNVVCSGAYGVNGKATTPGVPSLDKFCVLPYDFAGNVIEKTAARVIPWPPGNTLLAPGTLAGQLDSQCKYLPDPTKGY